MRSTSEVAIICQLAQRFTPMTFGLEKRSKKTLGKTDNFLLCFFPVQNYESSPPSEKYENHLELTLSMLYKHIYIYI